MTDVPSEILVFGHEASKKPSEREFRRGSENGPQKRHENVTFGGSVLAPFLSLGQLWALSRGTLLLSFCLLVPRPSKREAQKRPMAAQELPKRIQIFIFNDRDSAVGERSVGVGRSYWGGLR